MKRATLITGFITLLFFSYSALSELNARNPFIVTTQDFFAGIFLSQAITESDLKSTYQEAKEGHGAIRVLIVPGHTPEKPGALYRGNPEWELTIKTSLILYNYLKNDDAFHVFITQDRNGLKEEFKTYFDENWSAIGSFIEEKKAVMEYLVEKGVVNKNQTVDHITVSRKTATELYGINKWANDNAIDIVLHVHFNDYPGRYHDTTPQYSGFSLYVPEKQYSNFKASRAIASHLFMTLGEYYAPSDLPAEEEIIIEDQELIAVGAFNTLTSAVTLIEYGYLYEPQFLYEETEIPVLHDLAYQTYRGLKHYFEDDAKTSLPDTVLLPYTWERNLKKGDKGEKDVLVLQAYLTQQGLYPPKGKSRNECPLTGIFGECTVTALQAFQRASDITPASGFFGPRTREVINATPK